MTVVQIRRSGRLLRLGPSAPARYLACIAEEGLFGRSVEFSDFAARYDAPGSIAGHRRGSGCGRFSVYLPTECGSIRMAIRPAPTRPTSQPRTYGSSRSV